MATSFDYDINSPSDNHVYDDEELALQLLAEELAFHSPSGNNWREGVPYAESPQAQSMACITQRDLELARMLQTREDEQSMFASSTENSRTDLELAKILQVDADEEMVVESAAEDKKSDLELAMLLQQQEDITANDFLIARQLQVLTKSKLRDWLYQNQVLVAWELSFCISTFFTITRLELICRRDISVSISKS